MRTRNGKRGQVAIFLVLILAGLALLFALNVDVFTSARAKTRLQNAADASALALARWQGVTLNLIGDLNMAHLAAICVSNENAIAGIVALQRKLAFVGPTIGLKVANDIAEKNGVAVSRDMTQAARLVAEFMEIFNGNREPSIRERQTPAGQSGVTSEPETPPSSPEQSIPSAEERPCGEEVRNPANEPEVPAVPETPPEPVTAPEPPGGAAFDLFSQPIAEPVARHSEPAPAAEPPPEPAIQAMPPETEPSGWPVPGGDNGDRGPVISRYATPLRDYAYDLPRIAPAIGRWAIIAVALALVLWGAIAGVRALYRATANTSAGEEEPGTPAAAVAETPEPAKPAVQKAAGASDAKTPEAAKPRTIQDIPPLYID